MFAKAASSNGSRPYKGGAPPHRSVAAISGPVGHVIDHIEHARAGRIRIVGLFSRSAMPWHRGSHAGRARNQGLDIEGWSGFVPAGTAPATVARWTGPWQGAGRPGVQSQANKLVIETTISTAVTSEAPGRRTAKLGPWSQSGLSRTDDMTDDTTCSRNTPRPQAYVPGFPSTGGAPVEHASRANRQARLERETVGCKPACVACIRGTLSIPRCTPMPTALTDPSLASTGRTARWVSHRCYESVLGIVASMGFAGTHRVLRSIRPAFVTPRSARCYVARGSFAHFTVDWRPGKRHWSRHGTVYIANPAILGYLARTRGT